MALFRKVCVLILHLPWNFMFDLNSYILNVNGAEMYYFEKGTSEVHVPVKSK